MTKNKVKGGKSAFRLFAQILSKDLASKTLTGLQNYVNSLFFLWQRAGTNGRNKKEARTPGVSHFFHVSTIRSCRPEVFLRKGVPKICSKLRGEHPSRTVISIKLHCNFIKTTLSHGCFFCKFAAYFRNTFS